MPTIILSYRRDDTGAIAGRIFDRLVGHYGSDQVFMDINSIPFGLDFREHIQETLKRCDVLLAIVGKNWAAANENGAFRINEENDWVRIEVEAALAKNIPVIPVLIDNASLPAPASLPEGLRNLVFRQAAPVDSGRDFNPHMARLIKAMDQLLAGQSASETKTAQATSKTKPRLAERLSQDTDVSTDKRAKSAKTSVSPEASAETSSASPRLGQRLLRLAVSPQGRLPRSTFAIAVVASFIVLLALVTGITALASENGGTPKGALILLVPWNWVMVALGSKRLHDLGWTAWLMAIPLLVGVTLPYAGLSVGDPINTIIMNSVGVLASLLPLAFLKGTEGPNRYGPDPLSQPSPTQ